MTRPAGFSATMRRTWLRGDPRSSAGCSRCSTRHIDRSGRACRARVGCPPHPSIIHGQIHDHVHLAVPAHHRADRVPFGDDVVADDPHRGFAVRIPAGLVRLQSDLRQMGLWRRDAVSEHDWTSPPRTRRIDGSPVAFGAPRLGINETPLVPEAGGGDVHPAQLHQGGRGAARRVHPDRVVVRDLQLGVAREVQEGARRVRAGSFLHFVKGEIEQLGVVCLAVLRHRVAAER